MNSIEDIYNQSFQRHQQKHSNQSKPISLDKTTYEMMVYDIMDWIKSKENTHTLYEIRQEFIDKIYKSLQKKYRVFIKKSLLIHVYRNMIQQQSIQSHPYILSILQKKHSRTCSGVTVITILTSPYPNQNSFSCKHNCYYCPNEPGQPRSYLKKEPAVARANRFNFDAQKQIENRLDTLYQNGHSIDKLEIIIEGGTFTEYPYDYITEFFKKIVYTCNTYSQQHHTRRKPYSLEEEIKINKHSKHHIIGICIETRPDALYEDNINWIQRFRQLGITRVQLGIQHTNNTILKKINRGHTIEDAMTAIQLLKDNCFKVDIHMMPDLPYSTPAMDKDMIQYTLKSPYIQADQVKIYPCQVVPWTVIQDWYKQGKYKPYSETNPEQMKDVLSYALKQCPPWIRFPRVMRDIPDDYIQTQYYVPNMRQQIHTQTMEIRSRECSRHPQYSPKNAIFVKRKYRGTYGDDYFLSYESPDNKCIFGFLRLRIPDTYQHIQFQCLKSMGLIRELHVYGDVQPVHTKNIIKQSGQHLGFGTKLLKHAEQISFHRNCIGTAIISGMGVVSYYKKRGYTLHDTFMIKYFIIQKTNLIIITKIIICLIFMTFIII